MSAKRSAKYSPMNEGAGYSSGDVVVIPQSAITLKNILVIFGVVMAFCALLVVTAFVLGIVALNYKPNPQTSPTSQPAVTTTPKPVTPGLAPKTECGDGQWKQIAFFDMRDPTQQCPQGWRGYTSPKRCCGRPVSDRSSCPSVFYSTNGYQYSKVCGRATGYQQGSPDGFASIIRAEPSTETVNGIYVDGVSVTYGNPRTHIWTFAVGLHERGGSDNHNCPCDGGASPPSFVGNNYFCETGDDTPSVEVHRFFDDDPLWDGIDCHNATCCSQNNPPWFKVPLTSPTTDDIEVRICGDQRTGDEDSPIEQLELYVQ